MVMGAMIKLLEGFNHQVAIIITGMTVQRITVRERECPLVSEALETAGLWPITDYIQQRH